MMKKFPLLPALFLILAMFAVAEKSGQKEVIFPEISALALGAWIMEKPPWQGSVLDLWLSPTLAAFTGMLIVRFFPYAPLLMITGAFCLVVLQLKLFRSGVLPSISAAILPVITRSESWYYPLSVCLLTGIIAVGRCAGERSCPREDPGGLDDSAVSENESAEVSGLAHWCRLLAGVTAVTAIAAGSGHLFMVAPPLIVAFIELSKPGGTLRDRSGKILCLLVFAAFSGVLCHALIHTALQLPVWLSAGVAVAIIILAYTVLRLPFPPAVAIALLPTILPPGSLWSYPWQVLCGSTAFVVISMTCFACDGRVPIVEGTSTE